MICYAPGMARPLRPSTGAITLALGLALGLVVACTAQDPAPVKVEAKVEGAPAEATNAPPPLTEEELALIAADPKDLTPELRRKRAYARRKQIMQNPDSPAARALDDLAEAHQAGELDVQRKADGVWLSAPGTKPAAGRPPAGWRPSEGKASPADAAEPSTPSEPSPAGQP